MTPGKALEIAQALALAQDPDQCHQHQVPDRNANAQPPHPALRDHLEEGDQIEIGYGGNGCGHVQAMIAAIKPYE